MSNSPGHPQKETLENRGEKKKILSSNLEMNEDVLKENNTLPHKKNKKDHLKRRSKKRKKRMRLKGQEKPKDLKVVPSCNTSANGNRNPDETVFPVQTLPDKSLALPPESEQIQEYPLYNEGDAPLDTHEDMPLGGFPNLGNTCYMNATLQSLFAVPSLARDLFSQGIPWGNFTDDNLIVPFSQLLALKDVCVINIRAELLLMIKDSVAAFAPIFCGYRQNDAHEFLGQCLNQLKDDMKKLNTLCRAERPVEAEDSCVQMSADNAEAQEFLCPIVANFEFELQISIVCRACGQAIVKTEPNDFLSVILDQETKASPLSIQNYFDLFFMPEEVEYNCQKCQNKNSVFTYKFRRLPRVLIVHLKRYSVDEDWKQMKNDQEVEISKYLDLSAHCDENTQPPPPLDKKASNEGNNTLQVSQETIPERLSPSKHPMELTRESNNSMFPHVGPDENDELQNFQGVWEGAGNEQSQRGVESGPKLDPQLVNADDSILPEKKLPASDSMMKEGDIFSLIHEAVSIPNPNLAESFQMVPESPERKDNEKTNLVGEFDHPTSTELLRDVCGLKETKITQGASGAVDDSSEYGPENKILGGFQFQGVAEQLYQNSTTRISNEFLQQSPPPKDRKLNAQEDPEKDLGRASEQSLQKEDIFALGSDESPENKDISESENTVAVGDEPNYTKPEDRLQTYKLISVVSHIGESQDSGHYVSDVYNFQKQAWFEYNDLYVSEIPEDLIQSMRLHNGYIFFYMHSDIFEVLSEEAASSGLIPSGDV